ncbi:MAG TPA: hypothetical protein PLL66_09650, partial [Bacteroidales bacterium]|nr:hypothetical protein [Bacteroidales bacterium]
ATSSNIKPAAFIKKDSQYFVRLYPLISRLISEYELKRKRFSSKVAIIIFFSISLLAILLFVFGAFFYR